MKRADLFGRAVDWTGQTWAGRIDQCASMLFCHGYLSTNQRERIGRMLEREIASAIEAASAGETTKIGSTEGESATRKGDAHD